MNQIKKDEERLSLKELLAVTIADIDIFLLKDKDQENDLDKVFTKDEIRAQLENTMGKIVDVLKQMNIPIDAPIVTAFKAYDVLRSPSISDRKIVEMRKEMKTNGSF